MLSSTPEIHDPPVVADGDAPSTTAVESTSAPAATVLHPSADPANPEGGAESSSVSSVDSSVFDDGAHRLEFEFGTYVGGVDPTNGLRSGHGVLTYKSGNIYDGEWRDGAANGIGEKRFTNGDVYRGGWVDGKRSGRGGYLYAEGHYFEGMYANDAPNGYGVLTTVGGDRYAGHWKDGRKDGKGRETLKSGEVFVGHWRDDKKQGRGKLFVPGAQRFIYGIWNQDRFFRELTEAEMGLDGEVDIVDQYGLPTDRNDPSSAAAIAARQGLPPPPPPPRPALGEGGDDASIEGLGNALTDAFLNGVAAVEGRLEALGRALERATAEEQQQQPPQQQRQQQQQRPPVGTVAPASTEGVSAGSGGSGARPVQEQQQQGEGEAAADGNLADAFINLQMGDDRPLS